LLLTSLKPAKSMVLCPGRLACAENSALMRPSSSGVKRLLSTRASRRSPCGLLDMTKRVSRLLAMHTMAAALNFCRAL
jgi:hypothetical protein